jgi:hypothetical protein
LIVLRKTLRVALLVGFIVSLSFFAIVVLNGELEPSGQPGLVAHIHLLQQPGSNIAHGWFPCAANTASSEGGCQYLKIIPATILLNGLLYAGVLFIPIYLFRLFSTSLD